MDRRAFVCWIDEFGIDKLAKRLKVDRSTVSHWKRGHCPRPQYMKKIRDISEGRITYDHIIEHATQGIVGGRR